MDKAKANAAALYGWIQPGRSLTIGDCRYIIAKAQPFPDTFLKAESPASGQAHQITQENLTAAILRGDKITLHGMSITLHGRTGK